MNLSQIIQALNGAYPNVQNYLKQSSQSERIIDTDKGCSEFTTDFTLSGFDVKNKSRIPFCLLQIDNKLIVAHKGGQCDCAFFYDDNFNLLEFKTNAFSQKNVSQNYKKAINQLHNTIKILLNKKIDILKMASNVEAHICFNNSYPRKKASEMSRSISFANKTGVKLSFENQKIIP